MSFATKLKVAEAEKPYICNATIYNSQEYTLSLRGLSWKVVTHR